MSRIIILRGIPGSGKSTYIKNNFPNAVVCSADHYFTKDDGTYTYDSSKIADAHKECYKKFTLALKFKVDIVVIDNTFTRRWEMQSYFNHAWQEYGLAVEVIRLECDAYKAFNRVTHNVALHKIKDMLERFEDFEGETIIST